MGNPSWFNPDSAAGEHTSTKWQGYINGAVESGLRAAEEVFAMFNRRAEYTAGF
jgi:monoamine oxidase